MLQVHCCGSQRGWDVLRTDITVVVCRWAPPWSSPLPTVFYAVEWISDGVQSQLAVWWIVGGGISMNFKCSMEESILLLKRANQVQSKSKRGPEDNTSSWAFNQVNKRRWTFSVCVSQNQKSEKVRFVDYTCPVPQKVYVAYVQYDEFWVYACTAKDVSSW